jgi:hypothetical protein
MKKGRDGNGREDRKWKRIERREGLKVEEEKK